MTDESVDLANLEVPDILLDLPGTVPAGEDRSLRAHMALTITRSVSDAHESLVILERVERALWACAIAASRDATLARQGYEAGARAFRGGD